MVLFNYSTKELTAKVVYYGPGLCGKTTNLQFIHENLPDEVRGKMLSLATKTDRTLFFDFLPIDLGSIRGMKTRVQLYTVPGQVFYNETRKLVLKGADGIVFVADSQETMLGANVESFRNLEENLKGHGMTLADMPHVLQFNKRDLPRLAGIEELNSALNRYNAPFYESVATTGIGVQDTLKAVVKLVLLHLTRKYDPAAQQAASPMPAAAPPTVARKAPATLPGGPASLREAPAFRAAAAATQAIPVSGFDAPAARTRLAPTPSGSEAASRSANPPEPPDFRGTGHGDVPPPPDFHGRGESDFGTLSQPEFDAEEIEELVEEVGESDGSGDSELSDLDYAPIAASPLGELEEAAEDLPLASSYALGPEDEDQADSSQGPEQGLSEAGYSAGPTLPAGASLEVDRGFDPEWGDPASIDEPEEDVEIERGSGTRADTGSPVLLTEVANDHDLFTDPGVEVARLDGLQDREIVVPIEVGMGHAKRRFTLSIRLHLDPVD
jgi:signal recognition particle receptor subunit beta